MKRAFVAGLFALAAPLAAEPVPTAAPTYRDRLPQDEVIYLLMPDRFENGDRRNDRGGLTGDRLTTGFDPTDKGFFHGGDLRGVRARLPYIQALGATAIWMTPIFKNKPVQGGPGQESAGYHGYWATDFTTVDPHFGTEADFRALVDAAHARGMKVYMDIVTNHTADVIRYAECPTSACVYRDRATWPYQRRARDGAAINPGFAGDDVRTPENFARLTDPGFAYTPVVPRGQEHIKKPDWLNDPTLYHNRGNSTFRGESSQLGDFVGLDDLMTENPRVLAGFIEVYGSWIDRFGIDGFRIDTAKHVNPEFWAAFVPAMRARAAARGIPNFHIFGEVMTGDPDPSLTAQWTRTAGLPAVMDYPVGSAIMAAVARGGPTSVVADVFAGDPLYEGGAAAAAGNTIFNGNYDAGRFAWFVKSANPTATDADVLARTELATAMVLTLRGVPVIYAGDEQGFVGDGNDQGARQDMFASRTPSYVSTPLVGTTKTNATASFGTDHPLFREIAALSRVRLATPALTRGRQVLRAAGDAPGLLAFSRFDPATGAEVLIAFNTAASPFAGPVQVEVRSTAWRTLAGVCAPQSVVPGSVVLSLPAFGYAVCAAN